ncbi:MAG: T9SS type A sorting domain-containing protein [Tannerellaceae bacterium]|jgi:hypothetical protein|nr:T9SS type A sorting domain-containing protein [Tannerellaceae bacterium]
MKNKFSLIVMLTFCALQVFAQGALNYSVSGLQSDDHAVVSFGSNSYLDTKTVSANGSYTFRNIPAGMYFIKIEASGYNLPNAQTVVVHSNGSIDPSVGISLVVTKMAADPDVWTHSWSEDVSNSGYTTTAYVNNPPTIEFLGTHIVPSDVPFVGVLQNQYNIILSDEEEAWTQEYAYRLAETMKTIPYFTYVHDLERSKFVLTNDRLFEDITVTKHGSGAKTVRISKDCFTYANPFLVNLDGVRGRFYSKRLHHALVDFATDFGNDAGRANHILRDRFGCTTDVPDYSALTAGCTDEDAGRFQAFHPEELVSIINMFEELPDGFHKTPHLNYLIRRMDGHQHPLYPDAAAVAWAKDDGYIEFMWTAFANDANGFETLRLILHEKTHFLWAFSFSDEIKNDWIKLGGWYRDPNANPANPDQGWSTTKDTEFVSAYAHAISPDEDMAESVAHYLKNPELLQSRSRPKYEFIRDRIMHGTRYISKIPDHLTFEVLNLHPDYDYPGKIKRVDIKVDGAPNEDKTVTVEIELNHMDGFEDGAQYAFTRITSPIFIDTDGEKRSQYVDMYLNPVDGNPFVLQGTMSVSKYSKTGYWMAGDIVVSDLQGNQRFEGRNDYVWNMYINNPKEDLEAPKYRSGSLNYQLSDTIVEGHKIQNLKVIYHVTDNIGVASVYAAIKAGAEVSQAHGTYDNATQTATVNILIPEYHASGYYYTVSAIFSDLAGNSRYIYFSDSPSDEPIKKIYITTPNPDYDAPEVDLNRITVFAEPTHPEAPDGETLVTINYYARDNKSGLGTVSYLLRDPQGINHFEYHYHRNFYTAYFEGDPTVWERYTINCVLPQGSAPGIWGLAELVLHDKAHNVRSYNFVETLIFEPDNSSTDYVLFSELSENNIVNLAISSVTQYGFGFSYRIIHEDTGEEISGDFNTGQFRNSSRSQTTSVDVSAMRSGKLIIIVQIKNQSGEVVAVRSSSVVKTTGTRAESIAGGTVPFIYPNPVANDLYIRSDKPIKKLEIYSTSGVCVYTRENPDQQTDVSRLPRGIYLFRINTDTETVSGKFIKQ